MVGVKKLMFTLILLLSNERFLTWIPTEEEDDDEIWGKLIGTA